MDNFDPDAFLANNTANATPTTQTPTQSSGFDPDAFLSTTAPAEGEGPSNTMGAIRAGLEGVGRGVLGPIVPLAEKLSGISYKSQREAKEAHPYAAPIGEGVGLVGSMFTGKGLASVMSKAGEIATGAAGLEHVGQAAELANQASKASEAANLATKAGDASAGLLTAHASELGTLATDAANKVTLGQKIGSSAVQQAAEMAVLQGSDEASKAMMDPNYSSEGAISNIGMAAALGAGTGAVLTGVVSPLWKATAGPKVDKFLNAIADRANNKSALALPEQIEQNLKTLNVEPSAIQRADLSDHQTANQYVKDLSRAEHPKIEEEKGDLVNKVSNSVFEPLGTNVEEMKSYDNNVAGRDVRDKVTNQLNDTFGPLYDAMDVDRQVASKIPASDEAKLKFRDKILETGFEKTAGNSDYLNQYVKLADQVLEQDTLAGFDKMDGQLRRAAKNYAQDYNISDAQNTVRSMIKDFKNEVIESTQKDNSPELIAQRQQLRQKYAIAEDVRDQLSDHFNINSESNRDFLRKMNDVTPEQLLKKFSIKNNVDGANFLKQYFPDAYQAVIANERKSLLKPAIAQAAKKGEVPIDINKVNSIIDGAKQGNQQYLNLVLPQEFMDRAAAARNVLNASTKAKDSGTPAGLWGILKGVGTSALAAVSYASGHGLFPSIIASELSSTIGKKAPEAYKLAYLKYLGSNQPIKSEGFKAMVDFFHESAKGTNALAKATKATLKSGTQVVEARNMPTQKDRDAIDKAVSKAQEKPDSFAQSRMQGDVGHYLPDHQAAIAQTTTAAMQYLSKLKPQPYQPSPIDKPIEPSEAQKSRYNRALDIAQNPNIVLQHLKDGTLQASDIQDINAMYPSMYKNMVTQLSNHLNSAQANDEPIPYRTKLGMGLFLGHPLDSTMTPTAIQNAQLTHLPTNPQQPQGGPAKALKSDTNKLGKTSKSYMTPTQTAEADRANRD